MSRPGAAERRLSRTSLLRPPGGGCTQHRGWRGSAAVWRQMAAPSGIKRRRPGPSRPGGGGGGMAWRGVTSGRRSI